MVTLLIAAGLAVLLWPRAGDPRAVDPCGQVDGEPSEIGLVAAGEATVCLVNRERTQRGLQPLTVNSILSAASLEHSEDMVRRDYFEHDTPEGRSVAERLRALGYKRGVNASAGENIAYGVAKTATPAAIVNAWMNSPGHREDILRPAFSEIGIGIALGAPTNAADGRRSATYTTDFGGAYDPTLPSG